MLCALTLRSLGAVKKKENLSASNGQWFLAGMTVRCHASDGKSTPTPAASYEITPPGWRKGQGEKL